MQMVLRTFSTNYQLWFQNISNSIRFFMHIGTTITDLATHNEQDFLNITHFKLVYVGFIIIKWYSSLQILVIPCSYFIEINFLVINHL